MLDGFNKLAEGVGKAIELVPDLYEDAFKPAAQETGKIIAVIPRAIGAALAPIRQWISRQEYNVAETEKLLAKKLEHVGEEKIVTPDPYVAVPAIQAISYAMSSEDLRDLYANLLAESMNIDTKDRVHPSFVEIIKQMSPTDAKVLKHIYACSSKKDSFFSNSQNYGRICVSIDNLIRLGLINIPYEKAWLDDSGCNFIRSADIYSAIISELNSTNNASERNSDYIRHTTFGASFYNVCIIGLR